MKHIQFATLMKALCILPLLIGLHTNLLAQHEVSGTVVDESTGEPLPGVSILIQGTDQGVATNVDGDYTLDAPAGEAILVFSYVGYESQEIAVAGRSEINVEMISAAILGEELVVVGYGTQRREDITSSVVSVRAEDFQVAAPRDAAELIKGKVSGLILSTTDGNPTGGTDISLRGTTTISGSTNPLVLIDGIPGGLNTVAPDNIESITVLKDGSAAAIYGSRGSNGVILITTKSHSGTQATLSYQGYATVQQIVNQPEFLSADEYRSAIQQHGVAFTDYGGDTDWQSEVLRNPASHNHTLSLSGGNASTSYTASVNFEDTNGIFLRSNNQNLRSRINVSHSMYDDALSANLNLTYRAQNHFHGSRGGGSFSDNVWYQALIRNPTDNIFNEEGGYQERPGFNYDNPIGLIREVDGETENRDLRFDGSLTWRPIQNVSVQFLGASNRGSHLRGYAESFRHFTTTVDNLNGYANRATTSTVDNLMELTATYDQTIEGHSINVLGGYSWQEVTFEGFDVNNRDFPTDLFGYNNIGTGSGLQDGLAGMSSLKWQRRLIGFFGRMNYDFDNRFILMGSVRYEGDSRFGTENKWGWFPAVSAGWRISNEAFMEDLEFLDELKVRGGFGITGIAPTIGVTQGAYQSLSSYSFGGQFFFDGERNEWVRYLQPSRNANPNLKWERKEELNIGIDFGFLNRFSGSIDVYQRNTKDMLFEYSVPVPPYLYDQIWANVGEMQNKGLEIDLQVEAIQTQDLSWTSQVAYSTNSNKLVSISNDLFQSETDFLYFGGIGESVQLPSHRVDVGDEVGNFWGYKTIDVALNCDYENAQGECAPDGQWIIEGADGQPKTYFDLALDDRQVIGNGVPDHNISWNNTFRYKNFDLNIFLRGAFGFQLVNETRLFYENPTQTGINLLDTAFHDVYGKTVLNNEWQYMSYYVEDGDYVKIDNITLGYTLDLNSLGVSYARLYVSGRNLHTFTNYSGLDPEVDVSGLTPGYDGRGRYPTTRTFSFGVNLRF